MFFLSPASEELPAFGYGAPHPGARGTSTLLNNVLLSTHYGRSDSCPLRRGSARVSSRRPPVRLLRGQVSLIHALGLPTIPSPTTCGGSASPGYVTHGRVEPRPHPLKGSSPHGNSELRHCTAGSSPLAGRIEFSFLPYGEGFLRTGRSPPAAAHPVSRRRSCSRLQVYVEPGEDSHLSSQVRFQAHSAAAGRRLELPREAESCSARTRLIYLRPLRPPPGMPPSDCAKATSSRRTPRRGCARKCSNGYPI